MRFLPVLAVLLPTIAAAQPAAQTLEQRVGSVIGSLSIQNAILQGQIEQLNATIAQLKTRVDSCSTPAPVPPPPK